MAILPAQTIRKLCLDDFEVEEGIEFARKRGLLRERHNALISPFTERTEAFGMTAGLGPCTYDMRLRDRLMLLPLWMLPAYAFLCLARLVYRVQLFPHVRCFFSLGSTIEHVNFPNDVCGTVMDKSSNARRGLSVFNTKFDPGFHGYPTLELHNCGLHVLHFPVGTPICQFKFERLEAPTEMPYVGRYLGQGEAPTPYRPANGVWE